MLLGTAALIFRAPAAAAEPQIVELVMNEYSFTPDRLQLQREVPYRLRVVNRGKELHELTAPDFFASIALDTPETLTSDRREVVVQPGEQRELRFVPQRAGSYPMTCADHDWAGMIGEIVVT